MSIETKFQASPSGLALLGTAGTRVVQVVSWIAENDRKYRLTQARADHYCKKHER